MTFADVLINLGYGNPGAVAGRVRAWRTLMDMVKPDIVRCVNAPGALLAARGTGIRSIVVGIGFLVPPATSPLPLLRTWAKDAKPERMAAREQRVLECMNQGLAAIGAPAVASVGALYDEADVREIYTYPELDDYGPRDRVEYRGVLQAAAGEAPVWPETPGKRVFAYLEPSDSVARVLQALAGSGLPVLAYLPHAPEELLKRYTGSNLKIATQPLDLMKTAAACDVGVSHGGHNIAATFLAAGKPQLVVAPMSFPERVTADKVAALGASLSTLNPDEIGVKLARLSRESAFAESARAYAARVGHLSMAQALKNAVGTVDRLVSLGPRR
jgi:UDP:flavonoid glycosyltransferase YjiC (YdhE family)